MKLTLGQAAKQANLSKPTLSRALKDGRLVGTKRADGSYKIDASELQRWLDDYRNRNRNKKHEVSPLTTPESVSCDSALQDEVKALRQEKIDSLEKRIIELEQERDDWKRQAERLLPAPSKPSEGLFRKLGQFFSGG